MSTLSLIIPVHNEAGHLPVVLNRIRDAACPIPREWIIVDDRSTDGSTELLRDWVAAHGEEEAGMRLIVRPATARGGKGLAITEGIAQATGDFIMVQDADLEYDPADIPALLQPLLDDRADVVYGSRFRKDGHQVHRTFHYLVNRFLTALSNLFSGIYLSDMETCYKLFRADLVQSMNLRSERFGVEVELTAYVAKVRARVMELPVSYFPRTRLSGKKINWRDGVAALWHLVHFNVLTDADTAFEQLPERYRP
ncbi:Undecaprenyl-phosphate mannosyltransferase [Paraconexibacter sp. AEG42_29]|uniref:Undecaprenyl-phosphate mannosyltransferase n=1 Tax=Paraconexibacter sp. AEG42_29 TaxID=2997339 RepID=A0AAU7B2A7_9ACTN